MIQKLSVVAMLGGGLLFAAEPRYVDVPAFTVIGYTARTSNSRETSGSDGRIGPLWGKFLHGGAAKISGVVDPALTFAVYSKYEGDYTGPYDFILGKSVNNDEQPSDDMTRIAIPARRYLVFPIDKQTPQAIQEAWQGVYRYFSGRTMPQRAYTIDFERYAPDKAEIYIATK